MAYIIIILSLMWAIIHIICFHTISSKMREQLSKEQVKAGREFTITELIEKGYTTKFGYYWRLCHLLFLYKLIEFIQASWKLLIVLGIAGLFMLGIYIGSQL